MPTVPWPPARLTTARGNDTPTPNNLAADINDAHGAANQIADILGADPAGHRPVPSTKPASQDTVTDRLSAIDVDLASMTKVQATLTQKHGFYTGGSAPADSLGKSGDLYWDTTSMAVYTKGATKWGPPRTFQGAPGTPGGRGLKGDDGGPGIPGGKGDPGGAIFRSGHGAPAASLGNNGDAYIDLDASRLYAPKAGGAWGEGAVLGGGGGGSGGGGSVVVGTVVGVSDQTHISVLTGTPAVPLANVRNLSQAAVVADDVVAIGMTTDGPVVLGILRGGQPVVASGGGSAGGSGTSTTTSHGLVSQEFPAGLYTALNPFGFMDGQVTGNYLYSGTYYVPFVSTANAHWTRIGVRTANNTYGTDNNGDFGLNFALFAANVEGKPTGDAIATLGYIPIRSDQNYTYLEVVVDVEVPAGHYCICMRPQCADRNSYSSSGYGTAVRLAAGNGLEQLLSVPQNKLPVNGDYRRMGVWTYYNSSGTYKFTPFASPPASDDPGWQSTGPPFIFIKAE